MDCEQCKKRTATVHLTDLTKGGKRERHLCEECAVSEGVTTTLPTVRLLGGDANADNVVSIYDLVALGASFGSPAATAADITGDGRVNVFDLVLVGANYGRAAPLPWP